MVYRDKSADGAYAVHEVRLIVEHTLRLLHFRGDFQTSPQEINVCFWL